MNIKQNKITVLNWVFCQSVRVRTFWKYENILVSMILKVKQDFMVFKQRHFLWSDLLSLTFIRSKQCFLLQIKIDDAGLSLFSELGISSQDMQFCLINRSLFTEEKRKANLFNNVHASQLTRQRTLHMNNAHLDRSRCWLQCFARNDIKTFSITVSRQKQIKFYVSSQNG